MIQCDYVKACRRLVGKGAASSTYAVTRSYVLMVRTHCGRCANASKKGLAPPPLPSIASVGFPPLPLSAQDRVR